MFLLTGDPKYVDHLERVLYNGFLSGVSLDGEKFFYVNPLASAGKHHRQPWFGCACCPVNVVRFLPSLPGYQYAHDADGIYVNLYAAGRGKIVRSGAPDVTLVQETQYPWDGRIRITVVAEKPSTFTLSLRIPAWCWPSNGPTDLYRTPALKDEAQPTVKVADEKAGVRLDKEKGYARIRREWRGQDVVELHLPMPVRRMYTHPEVKDDAGRVALARGPVVYCFEGADNGKALAGIYLPPDAPLAAEHKADLLGGVTVIRAKALQRQAEGAEPKPVDVVAVPYYAWDHREPGPMMVWMAENPEAAQPMPKP
jgi:DUF1680 family protein